MLTLVLKLGRYKKSIDFFTFKKGGIKGKEFSKNDLIIHEFMLTLLRE
jgi:hypothetical protein